MILMICMNLNKAKGFGDEVKRRLMIGTYVLSAGYHDAHYLKVVVRQLISDDFKSAFEKCDVILRQPHQM